MTLQYDHVMFSLMWMTVDLFNVSPSQPTEDLLLVNRIQEKRRTRIMPVINVVEYNTLGRNVQNPCPTDDLNYQCGWGEEVQVPLPLQKRNWLHLLLTRNKKNLQCGQLGRIGVSVWTDCAGACLWEGYWACTGKKKHDFDKYTEWWMKY